jgi:site-specific recombinase XerD
MRRVALDEETVDILRAHLDRQKERLRSLGERKARNAYLFSLDPDCGRPLLPDSVSQRFDRLAERVEINTSIHKLRHYNATELIAAGVDLRTGAGRLSHSGNGATTLRVYTAWVAESTAAPRVRSHHASRAARRHNRIRGSRDRPARPVTSADSAVPAALNGFRTGPWLRWLQPILTRPTKPLHH